jgi:hypothetical protein
LREDFHRTSQDVRWLGVGQPQPIGERVPRAEPRSINEPQPVLLGGLNQGVGHGRWKATPQHQATCGHGHAPARQRSGERPGERVALGA